MDLNNDHQERVTIEDANGNPYVEFVDVVGPNQMPQLFKMKKPEISDWRDDLEFEV
tara:strand:+ start:145 stop:312 length:168 start_codon:yes stop_codon:yes gene_type:complete